MLLQSQRLYLREVTLGDAEVFFRMDSDPEVMRHIGGAPTTDPEVTRAGLGRIIAAYARRPGFGAWACCLRDGHRCLGWVGLKPCSLIVHAPASAEIETGAAEPIQIGYRLLRADWGRGYATEMVIEVLRYG
ncbi:MAG TPA: GNAT family N-acetyltransferase, partial [Polyangiaceae bacterium]|nr:GNAT family N-acetyltransferase [Polyangiaceae bacterium]